MPQSTSEIELDETVTGAAGRQEGGVGGGSLCCRKEHELVRENPCSQAAHTEWGVGSLRQCTGRMG